MKPSKVIDHLHGSSLYTLDIETAGEGDRSLHRHEGDLAGISIGWTKDGENVDSEYIDFLNTGYEWGIDIEEFRPMLNERLAVEDDHVVTFHQANFDIPWLWEEGFAIHDRFMDTMWISHIFDSRKSRSLQACVKRQFDHEMDKSLSEDAWSLFPEKFRKYGQADGYWQVKLALRYLEIFKDKKEWAREYYKNIVGPNLIPLCEMLYNGFPVSAKRLKSIRTKLRKEQQNLHLSIINRPNVPSDLNINSSKQLSNVLYNRLNLPTSFYGGDVKIPETKSGYYSTAKEYLNLLQGYHDIIDDILRLRKVSKLDSTFADALLGYIQPDGRVYTDISFGPKSGRYSSSDPNLQNQPKLSKDGDKELDIRRAFVAPEGMKLVAADYSQLELRLMAHISKDDLLMEAYREGKDVHEVTRDAIREQGVDLNRREAKTLNYLLQYLGSPYTLCLKSDFTFNQSVKYRDLWWDTYSGVDSYYDKVAEVLLKRQKDDGIGWTRTYKGRRRFFDIKDEEHAHGAKNTAGNHYIQGCISLNQRILTKEYGYIEIGNIMNKVVTVWDGNRWSKSFCSYSGEKEKVIVKLKSGEEIICSPDHKFKTITSKGNIKWKEPDQLTTDEESTTPTRIRLTNTCKEFKLPYKFPEIEKKYNKSIGYMSPPYGHNTNDCSLNDDFNNDFELGVLLGRLASDGTKESGCAMWFVANHEKSIKEKIKKLLPDSWTTFVKTKERKGKRKDMHLIYVYSKDLCRQLDKIKVKKRIPEQCWKSKELLRGYLRGMFDGDGGLSGNQVVLTFGKQKYKKRWAREVQQGLYLFGIRSRVKYYDDRTLVRVKFSDSLIFLEEIGFINKRKTNKLKRISEEFDGNHISDIHGRNRVVKSVNVEDYTIPMADIINSETGEFMTNGVITHNSGADIINQAMTSLSDFIYQTPYRCELLLQMHDELVSAVDENHAEEYAEKKVEIMEEPGKDFDVPIEVDVEIGDNWGEL